MVSTLSASRNLQRLTIEHYLVVVCRPLYSYIRYHSPNNAAKQSKSTADCKSYLIPDPELRRELELNSRCPAAVSSSKRRSTAAPESPSAGGRRRRRRRRGRWSRSGVLVFSVQWYFLFFFAFSVEGLIQRPEFLVVYTYITHRCAESSLSPSRGSSGRRARSRRNQRRRPSSSSLRSGEGEGER